MIILLSVTRCSVLGLSGSIIFLLDKGQIMLQKVSNPPVTNQVYSRYLALHTSSQELLRIHYEIKTFAI